MISWPLVTLAVPETVTGEPTAVLASGLSMLIFSAPGMGVAAVLGSEELAGVALVLARAEAEAEALADALGESLGSTKVVVLSLPHAASAAEAATNSRTTPNPFITLSNGLTPQGLRATPFATVPSRAHYSSRA
jgi:hypothetical protein